MTSFPTRDRFNDEKITPLPVRRPAWIKVQAPSGEVYASLQDLMRRKELHTVCEEAGCPNMGECWGSGTATFLILGDVCTRACRFCDIKHGRPGDLDWDEPERVAQAVKAMNLKHAVITSVNRDEREDGGAPIFASVIRRIREFISISVIYKKSFKELVRWGCPTQGQFPRGTHLRLRPRDRVPLILATRWSLVLCSCWFRWTSPGCCS